MQIPELLTDILSMSDPDVLDLICGWFRDEQIITDMDNYVYIKTESPICLVAHIDTVRNTKVAPKLMCQDRYIVNKAGILGADDRAGVFMLLSVYSYVKGAGVAVPQFLFTNYEESFGIGVREFIKEGHFNSRAVKFIIEADRMGRNEYVNYHNLPDELHRFMKEAGYVNRFGTYSDIYELTASYRIPSVNISAGYYNQHTKHEFLDVSHMNESLNKLINIVNKQDSLPEYVYKGIYSYDFDSDWDIWDDVDRNVGCPGGHGDVKIKHSCVPGNKPVRGRVLSKRERKRLNKMAKRRRADESRNKY